MARGREEPLVDRGMPPPMSSALHLAAVGLGRGDAVGVDRCLDGSGGLLPPPRVPADHSGSRRSEPCRAMPARPGPAPGSGRQPFCWSCWPRRVSPPSVKRTLPIRTEPFLLGSARPCPSGRSGKPQGPSGPRQSRCSFARCSPACRVEAASVPSLPELTRLGNGESSEDSVGCRAPSGDQRSRLPRLPLGGVRWLSTQRSDSLSDVSGRPHGQPGDRLRGDGQPGGTAPWHCPLWPIGIERSGPS